MKGWVMTKDKPKKEGTYFVEFTFRDVTKKNGVFRGLFPAILRDGEFMNGEVKLNVDMEYYNERPEREVLNIMFTSIRYEDFEEGK